MILDNSSDHDYYQELQEWSSRNGILQSSTAGLLFDISIVRFAASGSIAAGPYWFQTDSVYRVARVYQDTQEAFFSSIQSDTNRDEYIEVRLTTDVNVPSRIYSLPSSSDRPLAGMRFAVKDVFEIAGLRTSVGSRSHYEYSVAARSTATAISALIKLGAVLVGKTKNTQFINGEDPQEWIDYSCPWNPRGDGYQNPDTSSSGSATAISSYDWLDFTLGSDTCGSISCPAAAPGVFAIRYSTDSLPKDGLFTVAKTLDSIGIFARSITLLRVVSMSWLRAFNGACEAESKTAHAPTRILYPYNSFDHSNPEVANEVEKFLDQIERHMNLTRTTLDIEKSWQCYTAVHSPCECPPMTDYFRDTTAHLHLAGFRDFALPFREQFYAKFGRMPYFDPVNAAKLKLSESLTPGDRAKMFERQEVSTDFVHHGLLESKANDPLPPQLSTIMLWPFSPQTPQYRDDYPLLTPHVNFHWDVDFIGPLTGLPHVTFPIGQYSFVSRSSGRTEQLPISMAIVGAHNSDNMLLSFLEDFLFKSGLITEVKTGKSVI